MSTLAELLADELAAPPLMDVDEPEIPEGFTPVGDAAPVGDLAAPIVGAAEGLASMGTAMIGALGGTLAGAAEVIRTGGDVNSYADVFQSINQTVNDVAMYEPRTEGGKAFINAIEEGFMKYVDEPAKEHLVEPNLEHGNPLMAAIGLTSAHGAAMLLPFKAPAVIKGGVNLVKGGVNLVKKSPLRDVLARQEPAAREPLVEVETGKMVDTPDAPIADNGTSFQAFKDFVGKSQDLKTTPHEGFGAIGRLLFYKPVQLLRDWKSPSLAAIADRIYAPTRADAPSAIETAAAPDLIDMTAKMQGKFAKAMDTILEPLKGRFGLRTKPSEHIVRALRTGKASPHLRAKALEIREFLDVMHETYVKPVLGDAVGYVKDYVPQVWRVEKIQQAPARFKKFLQEKMDFTEAGAENFVRRIVENEGTPDMEIVSERLTDPKAHEAWSRRIAQPGSASKAAHIEKSRKVQIPEEALRAAEEWLVNDIQGLMTSYIRNVTRRVEYARMFGANEGRLNATVAKSIKELGIEGDLRAIGQLTKDVYSVADALQNKYNPIESMTYAKWNRRVSNYETVLHMGLVSLASLAEFAAPAIQFGFVPKAYAKGVIAVFNKAARTGERLVMGKNRIPKMKTEKALESLGQISLNTLQSSQAARFSTIGNTLTSRFMHATGLEALTDVLRMIAYDTISAVLERNAKALTKGGKKNKFYREQLNELGVSPDVAVEWFKQGMPKEGPLADIIENAKGRGTRWAVTSPNPATRPLLFSDPHWTNVTLFKSFTGVFSNLFMKRALSELGKAPVGRKASVMGGMVAATTIAYYTQFLREFITGRQWKKDDMQKWLDGIDKAAIPGPFTHAYQLFSPYRYGFMDNTAHRLFGLMGPAVSDAAKAIDVVVRSDMSKRKKVKEIAKLIPIVNITEEGREAAAEGLLRIWK